MKPQEANDKVAAIGTGTGGSALDLGTDVGFKLVRDSTQEAP